MDTLVPSASTTFAAIMVRSTVVPGFNPTTPVCNLSKDSGYVFQIIGFIIFTKENADEAGNDGKPGFCKEKSHFFLKNNVASNMSQIFSLLDFFREKNVVLSTHQAHAFGAPGSPLACGARPPKRATRGRPPKLGLRSTFAVRAAG